MSAKDRAPQAADWAATAALIALFALGSFVERGTHGGLRLFGVAALLASLPFLFPPFALLKRHGAVPDGASYCDTTTVVDRGVYAVVRHPQYLGYTLLAVGFGCRLQNALTTALSVAVVVFLYVQAVREEQYCAARLGEPYRRYMECVPRFNFALGLFKYARARRGRSGPRGGA